MDEFNVLTGFKGAFDNFDKCIYGVAGFFLGESRTLGHGPDDICFCKGHDSKYFSGQRYEWFVNARTGKNPLVIF